MPNMSATESLGDTTVYKARIKGNFDIDLKLCYCSVSNILSINEKEFIDE